MHRGTALVITAGLAAAGLAWGVLGLRQPNYQVYPPNLDVAEYAGKARLLRTTGRFETLNVYPIALEFPFAEPFMEGRQTYFPTVDRGPMGTILLALWQTVAGDSEGMTYAFGLLGLVLIAGMNGYILRKWNCAPTPLIPSPKIGGGLGRGLQGFVFRKNFNASVSREDNRPLPRLAVLILSAWLAYPLFRIDWISGNGEGITAAVLYLVFVLLYSTAGRPLRMFAAGLVFSCVLLIRFELIAMAPAVVYLVWRRKELSMASVGSFAAGVVLPLLPWWIRNYLVSGSPFFVLQAYTEPFNGTPYYNDWFIYRQNEIYQTLSDFIASNPVVFLKKCRMAVIRLIGYGGEYAPFYGALLVSAIALVFRKTIADRTRIWIEFTLLAIGLDLVCMVAIGLPKTRYLFPLVPLAHLSATPALGAMASRRQRKIAFVLYLLPLLCIPFFPQRQPVEIPAMPTREQWAVMAERIPEQDVILSDSDTGVSFYLNRVVILAPLTVKAWERALESPRVRWVVLADTNGWYPQTFRKYTERDLMTVIETDFTLVPDIPGPYRLYARK